MGPNILFSLKNISNSTVGERHKGPGKSRNSPVKKRTYFYYFSLVQREKSPKNSIPWFCSSFYRDLENVIFRKKAFWFFPRNSLAFHKFSPQKEAMKRRVASLAFFIPKEDLWPLKKALNRIGSRRRGHHTQTRRRVRKRRRRDFSISVDSCKRCWVDNLYASLVIKEVARSLTDNHKRIWCFSWPPKITSQSW